jgi:hypothetical protein
MKNSKYWASYERNSQNARRGSTRARARSAKIQIASRYQWVLGSIFLFDNLSLASKLWPVEVETWNVCWSEVIVLCEGGGQVVRDHLQKVAPFLNRSLRLGKGDFCFSSCLTPGEAPATKALRPATLCISALNVPLRLGSKGHFWHRKHACKGHLYSLITCAKCCGKPLSSL